jgi:glutamate racemase
MEPAIKPAIRSGRGRRILLLATSLTLREKKLENLIRSVDIHRKVDKLPLDRLVEYAEKLDFSSNDVQRYIREEFDTVDINQYETVVLGCTHFIYYRELLRAILPDGVDIIDGNEGTVRNILRHLKEDVLVSGKSTEGGEIHFYSSGVRESEERERKLLGLIK